MIGVTAVFQSSDGKHSAKSTHEHMSIRMRMPIIGISIIIAA